MRINTNIASLTAQRNLANTTRAFARALERLSSGKRINRAGDDAAGLAISARLESQSRGLLQSSRNLNEAFGYLNTAESAFAIQTDLVQKMRELAVQAATGTLSTEARSNLDTEFQSLRIEFERVAEQTSFNGIQLLDGTMGTINIQVGGEKGQTIGFTSNSGRFTDIFAQTEEATSTLTGLGTFSVSSSYYHSTNDVDVISKGDFDNDGDLDILSYDQSPRNFALLLNDGQGHFTLASQPTIGNTPNVVVGDINGDSRLDLVAGSTDGVINYRLGNGDGTFQSAQTINSGYWGQVTLGDFDNDNDLDIYSHSVLSDFGNVFLNDGLGSFSLSSSSNGFNTSSNQNIYAGDYNEDGKDDLLIFDHNSSYTLISNGDGTFTRFSTVGAPASSNYRQVTDFNNDGHLDYVETYNTTNCAFKVFLGDGQGNFAGGTAVPYGPVGGSNGQVTVGDFDGDGWQDVAAYRATDNLTYLYTNNDGSGSFTFSGTMSSGAGLVAGDFNDDGFDDIALGDGTTGVVSFYTGDTEGSITPGGVIDYNILTQENAQNILEYLDDAVTSINANRASIGATQNRMQSALSNTLLTVENINAARSQIIDADLAEETAELTRAQILQQAGVSVLGQANTSLQMVLGLLRF